MSNSSLVSYIKISPNRTSPRNHAIDTITIHCTAGNGTARAILNLNHFVTYNANSGASCNYAIGYDGSIGMGVEEKDRSWCTSNRENDHRAITIEVSSDNKYPYAVSDKAMASLINLLVDICQRNNIKRLKWKADKSLIGQTDKQNMTVHRWFANKECPGEYLYSRHPKIATEVNERLNAIHANTQTDTAMYGIQIDSLMSLNDANNLKKEIEAKGLSCVIVTKSGKPIGTDAVATSHLVYVVKSGDTLDIIAKKYNTTYQELARYNDISNPNKIYVGQKIKIPMKG